MVLKKYLMVCTAVLALSAHTALPAAAAPWTRGYVVGAYEYAFRFGGRGSEIEPGVDCPRGSSNHFANDVQTRIAVARQKWRSQQEIDWILEPPGLDQARGGPAARIAIWRRAIAYRGYKRGIETYINPWAADDPGQPQVTGRIGEGFNLDSKIGANDFVSPDGEKGIDNALYRAWGCDTPWRGNGNASYAVFANDKMREGLFTMVIRLSGNQDPMNDSDATMEIGYSPDKIVKDARGGIAVDYTYRILQSAQYTRLKATIKNGAVETEQVEHLHTPRIAMYYEDTGDTNFIKGKIRLNTAPDGLSGTGLIGGYRNWRDLYAEHTFVHKTGADTSRHEDHVSLYYALRRNADGMYNARTGMYDGISTAYRIKTSSAYVVDPDEPMDIPVPEGRNLWKKRLFEAIRANTIKGIETRIPQDVPPGSGEADYPVFEQHSLQGLPSRDFFLKTLDRPHYPNGVGMDQEGNPIDDQGNRIDERSVGFDGLGNPVRPGHGVDKNPMR